jgi:uncharacterized membrane protein
MINFGTGPQPSPNELPEIRNVVLAVYILQALSFLWGVTAIVGVVVSYVKRDDARGTDYESHFDWQIRTFWWGLLWTVIGVVLTLVIVGFAILFAVWVWSIYRVVKGWIRLNENKPMVTA